MHTHIVFFWLKTDLGDDDHARFEAGLKSLTSESHILDRRIGKAASTRRDVVDSSYSYSIVLRFPDLKSHDIYQVSEEHDEFLDGFLEMIERVQVYDVAEMDATL